MSDTSASSSLAVRAKRLAALARAKTEDENESQDQRQVETALRKLNTELATLRSVLAAHRKLQAVGVPVSEVQDLDKPAVKLREQVAAVGRPTVQYLTARVKELTTVCTAMAEGDRQAWRTWAEARIEELPMVLVPRLGFQKGATVRRIASMRTFAADSPTVSNVVEFRTLFGRVWEDLDAVKGSSIDVVLARFTNSRIRLADLSNDELGMLRDESSLSDQLYLYLS